MMATFDRQAGFGSPLRMKIAILGADVTTLELARAAARRPELRIVALADLESSVDKQVAELQQAQARDAVLLPSWEDLLDRQLFDGVIVAHWRDQEHRSEELRKLVQVGMPMLVAHPVVDSMLLYYELDMIRRDNHAVILPALIDRMHPAIASLHSLIRSSQSPPLGRIEQVAIERQMPVRSRTLVREQFSRDADLLRFLCGELNQIGAMGTSGDENAYGNLSVQLTGPSGLLARWSVVPLEGTTPGLGTLTITGVDGRASLTMSPSGVLWTITSPHLPRQDVFPDWSGPDELLKAFVGAIRNDPPDVAMADWLDAARSVELTETIGRSLARRRTIDLHFEDHTEQNTFKGMMAAGGCLLLMLGMGVLLLVALLDKARIPGMGLWPWLLAIAFGGFLALQLLAFVFRK